MEYKGNISISRFSGTGDLKRGILIQLSDATSSNPVVQITLTPEDFGNVISGLGYIDCTFELYNLKNIGKTLEVRTEKIVTAKYEHSDDEIKSLCKPYEKDGWHAHYGDFKNHHKKGNGFVTVGFSRYV